MNTLEKSDPGAGGHRNAGSNSANAIAAALVPTLITAAAFLLCFLALRSRYRNIYAPRTYFRSIPQKDRTPSSSHDSVSWYHDFRALDDKFVLRHSSLEAYLFLRYLRMIVLICVVGCCLTWPILLPVNYTGGGDSSQLDKLSFSNVLGGNRLYAHAIIGGLFFAFIVLLVTRERLFVVGLRQAYQKVPLNATRLSSRVVLYLSVPPEGLREGNLQRYFGKDAVRSWVVSNLSDLEKLVAKRDGKIDTLEGLEVELLKNANKEKGNARNGRDAVGDSSHGSIEPEIDRHKPRSKSKYIFGDDIDSIERLRAELSGLISDLDNIRQTDSDEPSKRTGAIFVEFKDQASAHEAFQVVRHPSPLALQPKYIGVQPKEVAWKNLNIEPSLRITYSYMAIALAVATIILWSIPVGIIGTISNIQYLADKFAFLRFINDLPEPILGLLTGLLPPLLLSTVVSYVPYFFQKMASLSGQPTTKEAVKWAQTWYFVFQVVQVFLITTFSSGAATLANRLANDPTSAPTLLAKNLPKASNFYLTYFIIQGLGTASNNVLNYSDLLSFLFYYKFMSKTPRQKFNTYSKLKGISWFIVYPKFTNLAVIAIAYSCIAPLVLGFAAIGIFLFYFSYRYNLLYVIQVKTETRGESYSRALQHMMTGVYLAELCLIGLFGTKGAAGPSTLMTILLVATAVHHYTVNKYLAPLEQYLPLEILSDEDEEQQPLLGAGGGGGGGGSGAGGSHGGEEERVRDRSRIYKLGRKGKVPTVLLDPLARYLEPNIFASEEALRPWLEDPEAEYDESNSYSDDQLKNAYRNPALTSKTPTVWLPRDRKGLSKHEVAENEKAGLSSTDDGAELTADNEIVWDCEDFATVPVFKEATRY
ncbi:putative membrane protein C24H6.13 [Exophiala dermatitidis]